MQGSVYALHKVMNRIYAGTNETAVTTDRTAVRWARLRRRIGHRVAGAKCRKPLLHGG